jgi:ABC-type polysaccharide/polyol phosphate export permease
MVATLPHAARRLPPKTRVGHGYNSRRPTDAPKKLLMQVSGAVALALQDLWRGLGSPQVWRTLAWQEIKQRYRRSTLGPFWLTISAGILVAAMGPLYGRLFGQEISAYFPYLAVGIIVWQLMAAMISESGTVFSSAEQYITQLRMPFTVHAMRMVSRNAIIFAHNFAVILLVLLAFVPGWYRSAWLALPGLFALLANGVWLGLLLGMLCIRFRDVLPILSSLVQVAFFMTPVMWKREMLGRHQWAADANPLYHFIEVVRAPLLGQAPAALSWAVVAGVTVLGFGFTLAVFARYRARIPYWL